MVDFQLLGQITAMHDDQPIPLPHGQSMSLAALLLLEPGRVVPTERIIDMLWPADEESIPRSPVNGVQQAVKKLRKALASWPECRIDHRANGYLITVGPDDVDLGRFRALVSSARRNDDTLAATDQLRVARSYLLGEPLTGADAPGLQPIRTRLQDEWLSATEYYFELELQLGRHEQVMQELTELTGNYPERERLHLSLILALYRAGRRQEALTELSSVRDVWVTELGLDPSPKLKELHGKVLNNDPSLNLSEGPVRVAREASVGPTCQLPAPRPTFSGRSTELARLDVMATNAGGGAPPVCVVSGPGGIGKSWLVVEWANSMIASYPDGQLYVDLQGFAPSGSVLPAHVVLRALLTALGVESPAIRDDVAAQAALYRGLISGRRMLIILDNARSTEQVLPLLPGGIGCTTIVTSRNKLTGLLTSHAAGSMVLEPLDVEDATALLEQKLRIGHVDVQGEAVAELVEWCRGLPLALSILASKAATHPTFPLDHLLPQLRSASSRLDAFDAGELTANLRAVLSGTDEALTVEAARAFRLLGLVPSHDVGLSVASAVLGLPISTTAAVLDQLENYSLIRQPTPDRYTMHDLVRLYAAEQAVRDLPVEQVDEALRRFVAFFALTAENGERILEPHRPFVTIVPERAGCRPLEFASQAVAMVWMDAEYDSLVTVRGFASDRGWDIEVIHLAWALETYQQRRGLRGNHIATWEAALAAAVRLDDPGHQSDAHRRLGIALSRSGRPASALHHLQAALKLANSSGNKMSEAHAHYASAAIADSQGDGDGALRHSRQALRLYEGVGSRMLIAMAMNALGWWTAQYGDPLAGRSLCESAILLQDGDPEGRAATFDSLGEIAYLLEQYPEAVAHHKQALHLRQELHNLYEEANSHSALGAVHHAMGEPDRARAAWTAALELYTAQHRLDEADEIRARLRTTERIDRDPC